MAKFLDDGGGGNLTPQTCSTSLIPGCTPGTHTDLLFSMPVYTVDELVLGGRAYGCGDCQDPCRSFKR